jgi:chaperonin GroES
MILASSGADVYDDEHALDTRERPMAFRLLHDRIAVLADELAETTASGLIVGEAAASPLRYGTVANVGTGHVSEHTSDLVPMLLSVDDRVFFHRASGQPLEIEGVEYVILSQAEIIGVEAP